MSTTPPPPAFPPPPPPPSSTSPAAVSLAFRNRDAPRDFSWLQDRITLKLWLLVFLAAWLGGGLFLVLGIVKNISSLTVLGATVFLGSLLPYVGSLVFAYRVQDKLNRAGLYRHGAWQVVVGGLLLNPLLLGWLIPVSVFATATRLQRSTPGPTAPRSTSAA